MVARREISGARHHLGEAVRLHRSALEANPENPSYRNGLYDDYGVLAFALLESGEPVEAAATAEELPRLLPERREPYLNAAALLARCASMVSQDARHPEPVRREFEEAYGKRAVDLLREADHRWLIRPKDLDSPQFLPLRSREDFRKLGEEAERKRSGGVG
jgi:hypothetical protein